MTQVVKLRLTEGRDNTDGEERAIHFAARQKRGRRPSGCACCLYQCPRYIPSRAGLMSMTSMSQSMGSTDRRSTVPSTLAPR